MDIHLLSSVPSVLELTSKHKLATRQAGGGGIGWP